MQKLSWRAPLGKAAVAVAFSLCAAFSSVPVALADPAPLDARVQEALNETTRLNILAEQSQYDLISSTAHLNATEELIQELDEKIASLQAELKAAKEDLAKFVADDYKSGTVSLLDIIFEAHSFDDMVSRIVYANKVAEHKNQTIARVDNLFTTLALQRDKLAEAHNRQKQYAAEQAERREIAAQAGSTAQAYYTGLSEDVKQGLSQVTAEQQAAAVEATLASLNEMIAERNESSSAPSSPSDPSTPVASDPSDDAIQTASLVEDLVSDISSATGGEVSQEELSDAISQVVASGASGGSYDDLLSRAYSLLGSGYQWSGYNWTGDTSSSSFTCSGVVDYALGRDSQSSSPETLYEEVGDNITTDISQLQEGDLVFYSYGGREVGHVGVYVGNGQVIDSIPNGGVAVRDVDYMDVVGGGSIG